MKIKPLLPRGDAYKVFYQDEIVKDFENRIVDAMERLKESENGAL